MKRPDPRRRRWRGRDHLFDVGESGAAVIMLRRGPLMGLLLLAGSARHSAATPGLHRRGRLLDRGGTMLGKSRCAGHQGDRGGGLMDRAVLGERSPLAGTRPTIEASPNCCAVWKRCSSSRAMPRGDDGAQSGIEVGNDREWRRWRREHDLEQESLNDLASNAGLAIDRLVEDEPYRYRSLRASASRLPFACSGDM